MKIYMTELPMSFLIDNRQWNKM